MAEEETIWNLHRDPLKLNPRELIERIWSDDDAIRERVINRFQAELGLVDRALTLYVENLREGLRQRDEWGKGNELRAALAMLVYGINVFLAWRQLGITGYFPESRVFPRAINEAMSRALVFSADNDLAASFLRGTNIMPATILNRLAHLSSSGASEKRAVAKSLTKQYVRLSRESHPSLQVFKYRTLVDKPGRTGFSENVPQSTMVGGSMSDALGHAVLVDLANKIVGALPIVSKIVTEGTGQWMAELKILQRDVAQAMKHLDPDGV